MAYPVRGRRETSVNPVWGSRGACIEPEEVHPSRLYVIKASYHTESGLPPDDLHRVRTMDTTVTSPFTCDGTLLRHATLSRPDDTLREAHDVAADESSPASLKEQVSTYASESEHGGWQYRYSVVDWSQCSACSRLDEEFRVIAHAHNAQRFHEQELRNYKEGQLYLAEDRKRKRAERKSVAESALAAPAALAASAPGPLAAISAWVRDLGKRCKIPQLKALCKANHVASSGAKAELLLRLAQIKQNGGPGPCPRCSHSRLEFTFATEASRSDVLARPAGVQCTFVHFPHLRRCAYTAAHGSHRLRPLADTADGLLAAAGLLGPL